MRKNDLRVEAFPGDTLLVLDTFTGVDATTLPSHVPDKRPGSNAWGNAGVSVFELLGNQARLLSGGGSQNNISIDAGKSDVVVEADVTMGAGADTFGGLFVRSSANDTGIECFLGSAADIVRITEISAGVRTDKVTRTFVVAPSTTYKLKVTCIATLISVYVDGVKQIEWNSAAFNPTAVRFGLWQWNVVTDSRFDNFRVSSLALPIFDVNGELPRAEGIEFSTGYPGGLYLTATMFLAREIVASWLLRGAQRVRILNGQAVVFEGIISDLERALQASGQGIEIAVVGYWGGLLASRRISRLYADKRTSPDMWQEKSGIDEVVDTVNITRFDTENNRNLLQIMPQAGVNWGMNDRIRIRYLEPPGEEMARMEFDADFNEGAQSWTTKLQTADALETSLWSRSTTGTETGVSISPAPGTPGIDFFLTSSVAQTSPAAANIWSKLFLITVYARMNHTPTGGYGTVNLTEIVRDMRGELADLSSDEDLIQSNTLSLKPFINERYATIADMLIEAASYGDSTQRRWAVGILGSHLASDQKPKMFAEPYPDLAAGYDYEVSLDDPNLDPGLQLAEGFIGSDENAVWNWIIVEYRDDRGFPAFVTPDVDANLKDDASILKYGQRHYRLPAGFASQTGAVNFGRRFLKAHKEAVWNVRSPINVIEYVNGRGRERIPAAEIRAGKRLLMRNFIRDPNAQTNDLVFLVTKTTYIDQEQLCSITVGLPNTLDVYLAQRELVDERLLG